MKSRIFALIPALALLFSGCALDFEREEYRDDVFFAMDTYITVRMAREGVTEKQLDETAAECERIVKELESVLSAHDPDSELYALNHSGMEAIGVSDTLERVLLTAYTVAERTAGAYDFTLGGLTELWNITDGGPVPPQHEINALLPHTGYYLITIDDPGNTVMRLDPKVRIDLGGIGKGVAADELVQYLETTDIPYGLVSVGGMIGVFGDKPDGTPYKIGIRDPDDPNGVLSYLHINDGFVAVSGDYERYFEENGTRYHHILDPYTGYPADSGLRETAVHCENGAMADALSTALFVMGADVLPDFYASGGFEAVLVSDDGSITATKGMRTDYVIP
jgi:thiamine biosynthesis lipoprotein